MELKTFVEAVKAERNAMALSYAAAKGGSGVVEHLAKAKLTEDQRVEVLAAIDQALSDAFYTLLLALDGAASLGGVQHSYRLISEDGSILSAGDGALESAAFSAFHE